MEFLEYLGSWDGVDAEWELFDAAGETVTETRSESEIESDANADEEGKEVEDSES